MRLAIALALCSITGCAATFDVAYLLGDRKTSHRVEESAPTERTTERVEYNASLATDGSGALDVSCHQRERAIERRWDVVKTYRRRGGYSREAYTGAAIVDGVVAGATAGIILAMCNQGDAKISCLNVLYAAPFAVDMGYALIRRATARPAVLIDKYKTTDTLGLGAIPTSEKETTCDSIASLWLGHASGPSDEDILKGYGEGRTRQLRDGAIPLRFEAPSTELTDEAATRWLASPGAQLWALDARGVPHRIETDRCALLRPRAHLAGSPETRKRFNEACPLPKN